MPIFEESACFCSGTGMVLIVEGSSQDLYFHCHDICFQREAREENYIKSESIRRLSQNGRQKGR